MRWNSQNASATTLPEEKYQANPFSSPVFYLQKTQLPRLPLRVIYTIAEDGANLALGNYQNKGAQPVILMHGLSQNYRVWDFPVPGHNFASYLHSKGYDVWLPCLRGHGSGPLQSSPLRGNESIDTLAVYDIPAVIEKVREETEKAPIWIGHSMGGMLAYIYLEGVRYERRVITQNKKEGYGDCIVGYTNLAQERNQKLKGLVALGTPVKMTWQLNDMGNSKKLGYWKSNKIFPFLVNFKSVRGLFSQLPYIPTASFVNSISYNKQETSFLMKLADWSFHKIANSYLASVFWYPPNMRKNLIEHLIHSTLNDISPKVLEQFADWVEKETFCSFPHPQFEPYIYSDHFENIRLPLLVLTGDRDKIAPCEVVYTYGYQRMGSKKKEYHCFKDFGHNDLTVGLNANKIVYPFIESWIRDLEIENKNSEKVKSL